MSNVDLVIVGSIGLDTIETKFDKRVDLLGGSVSYACAASSFFTKKSWLSWHGQTDKLNIIVHYQAGIFAMAISNGCNICQIKTILVKVGF